MNPYFSILVVCLNPGDKLKETLASISRQTYKDYEVLIKDGGSTDGALEGIEASEGLRIVRKKDAGIYDAMNQAVEESRGRYIYFLNCGDRFADERVLEDVAQFMRLHPAQRAIYYGNIYERLTGQVVASNPRLDDFGCYRNVPCHQACFYERELLFAHPFRTQYRVRADYEQFLWCYFRGDAKVVFTGRLIADYEGGGFSETRENRLRSEKEHKEIAAQYMSRGQIAKYKLLLWITLAPLRTRLAQNAGTAKLYNKMKGFLYTVRKRV